MAEIIPNIYIPGIAKENFEDFLVVDATKFSKVVLEELLEDLTLEMTLSYLKHQTQVASCFNLPNCEQ